MLFDADPDPNPTKTLNTSPFKSLELQFLMTIKLPTTATLCKHF